MSLTSLETAVLGPVENGRGYTVLARSTAAPGQDAAVEGMLRHFSLALAGWADRQPSDCVVMFPLDAAAGTFAVARVAFLGEAQLGTVAMAHVLVLPLTAMTALDWLSHRLLAHIPTPTAEDDLSFADASLKLDLEVLAQGEAGPRLASFGLEWRDHEIAVGAANPEAVLAAAIEGMDPPEQRARLTGWVTSGAFTRSGAFDPDEAFRLIVRGDGEGEAQPNTGRRLVRLTNGQIAPVAATDATLAPPVAWRVWAQVEATIRARGVGKGLEWQPRYADHAPDAIAAIAILEACLDLDPVGRAALLSAVAESSDETDDGPDLLKGAAIALGRLMDQPGEPEGAAWYLNDYIEASADRPAAVASVAHLALRDGVLPWMSAQSLDLLAFAGLADRLAAQAGYPLDGLPVAARLRLLKASIQKPGMVERRALTVRLIGLCLPDSAGAKPCAQAIAALLALPAGPEDAALATPAIYDLLQVGGSSVRTAYARRVLSPVLREQVRLAREPYVMALRTALHAVSGDAR
ncbi:MAG TPA: hypothetical protein VF633_04980 [Brevundimonas sp.]